MEDRGCRGRTARKHWPVLPAISILPSGSLATSFAKPIPRWDEMGRRRRCCSVFNQRWKKKKKRLGLSWYPLKGGCQFFSFSFFCACGFCESEKQRHDKKDKEHELQQGPLTTPHCLSPERQSGNMCTFSFLKGKSIDWEMIVLQICLRRTFPHST